MQAWVNGHAGAGIDPSDRGLNYGDGLFETLAVSRGRPRFLGWHLERLLDGCQRLGIPSPEPRRLQAEIERACPDEQGVVKLIVTRGSGERGYRPPRQPDPTRIVVSLPWPAYPPANWSAGVRLRNCRTRLGRNPALAGIKHLNRLEQVLARGEWDDADVAEGIMMDDRDRVIGATQSNLFARIGGRWATPRLDQCGVAGVMRRAFLGWSAQQGDPVDVRALSAADLGAATAVLLTNALIGAWPVREMAGRPLVVDRQSAAFNAWVAAQ